MAVTALSVHLIYTLASNFIRDFLENNVLAIKHVFDKLFQEVLERTTSMEVQYIPYWKIEGDNHKFRLAASPHDFGAQLSCQNTGPPNIG